MKPRRKALPAECSGAERLGSQIGTPLRQMTITESFKYTKPKAFKMETPVNVSGVCHVISDSDEESPPQFEFQGAGTKTENDSESFLPDKTIGATIKSENDSETFYPDKTMDGPSPPKKPRQMMKINYPGTSTPKTLSNNNNVSPTIPKLTTIESQSPLNGSFANLSTGSPLGQESNSSTKTIRYEYKLDNSNCFDESTVEFPLNREFILPSQISNKESLVMNFEENASDAFSPPRNGNNQIRPSAIEANPKKNSVAKQLIFNSETDNNKATNKKEPKRKIPKKNKTTDSVKQDQSRNNTGNTPDIITKTPKKARKRKICTESSKNDQKINSTVKDNSLPQQNTSSIPKKVHIKNSTTLISPITQSESSVVQLSLNKKMIFPTTSQNSVARGSSKLPVIAAETLRKGPANDVKKAENLNGIIDKLRTNKEVSVNLVHFEKTADSPKNPPQSNVATPVGKGTVKMMPSTGIKPGPPRRNISSAVKGRSTTRNQAVGKTVSSVAESQNNSTIVQSKTDASGSVILEGLDKAHQKVTPRKIVVDDQQPGCSKSLTFQNSTRDTSSKKDAGDDMNKNTTESSPGKQKMGPNTPLKNGSRKPSGSPIKGSPINNREIKTLKNKEGKILQVRQMDELVKLFRLAEANRHLRTLLNSYERDILQKFVTMEDNKRYFVMKLFVWQRLWYNIFNFCSKANIEFDDEKDITDIFQYLKQEEFVHTDYITSSSLLELLDRLDRFKVKEIMDELKIKPIRNKAGNIKTILSAASRQTTLTTKTFKDRILESIKKKMGFAFKIKEDVFNTLKKAYLLATFTNPDFFKEEDYFRNIIHAGVIFPETPVEDYLVFYSREKFESYVQALKMRTELEEQMKNKENKFMGIYDIGTEAYERLLAMDTEDKDDYSKAPHLKKFTAQHVYTGILSSCCDKIYTKRNGQPSEVKKWLEYLKTKFPNSKRLGRWYEILIRLHKSHLDPISYESAAKVLIEALDPKKCVLGEIAKHNLGELGQKLKSNRRYKIDQIYHDSITDIIPRSIDLRNVHQEQIDSQCIRSENPGRKRDYISKNNEGMTVRGVEEVALKHYAEHGYPEGEHCEGSIIKALLMLCFWDIIYNPPKSIPGTFLSKLQNAPLDMCTPYFYTNRKEMIDKRLEEIAFEWSEEKLVSFAARNWQEHSHESAAFGMIMEVIKDEPTVEVLITVIGRTVLAKIFKRLITNIREFSSGMPDLLVWNVEKKECKFVEVKGEGDRLSMGQKLWLQYLGESGASIEICHVHSMGSKRKKIKNVSTEQEENNEAGPSSRPDD